jgi:hypothetical protein
MVHCKIPSLNDKGLQPHKQTSRTNKHQGRVDVARRGRNAAPAQPEHLPNGAAAAFPSGGAGSRMVLLERIEIQYNAANARLSCGFRLVAVVALYHRLVSLDNGLLGWRLGIRADQGAKPVAVNLCQRRGRLGGQPQANGLCPGLAKKLGECENGPITVIWSAAALIRLIGTNKRASPTVRSASLTLDRISWRWPASLTCASTARRKSANTVWELVNVLMIVSRPIVTREL